MTVTGLLQLAAATVIFLFAAALAKSWALAPALWKIVLTLALYSAGNLIMMRLVRDFGMSTAFSLSAVIQLAAVNIIALGLFGERLSALQALGVGLALVSVGLIALGPYLSR